MNTLKTEFSLVRGDFITIQSITHLSHILPSYIHVNALNEVVSAVVRTNKTNAVDTNSLSTN